MEEFDDDDDFSDLYADVEVQASSAISAMHGLTEMPPAGGEIFTDDNDGFPKLAGDKDGVFEHGVRGEEEENLFNKTEIAAGNGGSYGNAIGVREAGEVVEGGRNTVLNDCSDGKKQRKQKFADNHDNGSKCSYKNGNDAGVKNARKHGGEEIEEEEKKEGGGINGNEKNLNAGDCYSQRECMGSYPFAVSSNLKHNGPVRADWQDNECSHLMDGSPVVGRRRSFLLPQSRGSRHMPACDSMSSDLEKYGTVQISDSEEDNHHKLSDCDSDGTAEVMETHDDKNIRKSSSKSTKVPSVVEPDFSCPRPCAAVSDDETGRSHEHSEKTSVSSDSGLWNWTTSDYHTSKDFESHCVKPNTRDGRYYERDRGPKGKSHKHSKRPLTSMDSQMLESFTCDYRPLRISKSHGVKPDTRDGRYYERYRDPIRKELKLQRRSNHVSNLKKNLHHEGAYDGIDIRGPYDMHRFKTGHGKQAILNSNEKDMPYWNGSQGYSTYFRASYPNYRSEQAYLKDQYWKVYPSFRCEARGHDDYNMNEKQLFLKRRRTKMDYEDLEDDRYRNKSRCTAQNMNHLNFEESRKLIPKYSSHAVNGRGTQFSERGDGMQFRGKRDDMPRHFEYDDDFVEGKDRRYMLNRDRKGDHLCHRYDQEVPHDRRDMESPGRGEMKYDSPFNTSDNSLYMDNERRYIKHQPLLHSYKETRVSSRARFHGAAEPKSLVHERPIGNMRCSWEERYGEKDRYSNNDATFDTSEGLEYCPPADHLAQRRHYLQSSITFNTNRSIRNHHNEDRFIRRRHHLQPETLLLNEEDYKSKWPTEIMFHNEGSSHHFERISRDKRPDKRHATDHVAEVIHERELDGGKYRLIGIDQRSKFVHPDSRVQMHQRYQDSTDPCLVVEGKKCTMLSSRRTSDAGDAIHHDRYNFMGWNNDRAPESFKESISYNPEKVVSADHRKVYTNQSDKNWCSKFSDNKQNEFLDIEEGQIIGEEVNHTPLDCETVSKDVTQNGDIAHPETASNGNRIADRLDDQRIQEIMTKMERRRERFKDPMTLNRDSEKTSKCLPDSDIETAVGKVVRPARKRKWLGS